MASYTGSDPLDEHNERYFTNYPHPLRTRSSAFAPNRATTLSSATSPTLQRRPPIPEDFRLTAEPTDLIDTAIVIKNIPFAYPEEDFLSRLFPQLGLVPPYAFNYHRNKSDRAFHGLAFANFNASHEAQAAVDILNNYELEGRRLRVELKKRLPAEEEQRQRLARQSRRVTQQPLPQANVQQSYGDTGPAFADTGATAFTTAIQQPHVQPPAESVPLDGDDILEPQLRPRIVFEPTTPTPEAGELDMNDPETLGFYTHLQLFRNNPDTIAGALLQFPSRLTAQQRRKVHTLAAKLNLTHESHGVGSERFIVVSRRMTSPVATQQPERPELSPQISSPELQGFRQFPTTRASTDHLSLAGREPRTTSQSPRLRTVASMGNLRSQRSLRPERVPPMPPLPFDMFTPYSDTTLHSDTFVQPRLGHRSSQESAISSGSRFGGFHGVQPTRQPIGPPQDQSRGFTERSSRDTFSSNTIRPIGHGAKTSSHGSLSHGSGGRDSRGNDSVVDLHVQSSLPPHPSDY